MRIKIVIVFVLYPFFCESLPVFLDPKPVCILPTPDSILHNKKNFTPLFIGNRMRYATCTGAAWFHDHYLAVLNLYGKKINTYKFFPEENRFESLQEITNEQKAQLTKPENLSVSPNGLLLAVCTDNPNAGVKLYSINLETHLIYPEPVRRIVAKQLVHNVRFSPNGVYLATAGWERDAAICIYKIMKNSKTILPTLVYQKANEYEGLVAKGINFTKDGRFAVVVYSSRATLSPENTGTGLIAVYTFDALQGSLGTLVCSLNNPGRGDSYEDLAFINNDTTLIFSNQNSDSLIIHEFDPVTGQIDPNYSIMQGTETQLDFPHGISVKSDERYVVITNYGQDACTLYQVISGKS